MASAVDELISAGAYVLERSVLELIPTGRAVSIEREIWPALIGNGLYGYEASGYWLDIGSPSAISRARSTSSKVRCTRRWRPRSAAITSRGRLRAVAGRVARRR